MFRNVFNLHVVPYRGDGISNNTNNDIGKYNCLVTTLWNNTFERLFVYTTNVFLKAIKIVSSASSIPLK